MSDRDKDQDDELLFEGVDNRGGKRFAPQRDLQERGRSSLDALRWRAVSSALWAAWGDALGFITELTDGAGALRRLGITAGSETELGLSPLWFEWPPSRWFLQTPLPWTRRIGGAAGVDFRLPAGAYSDDTQLRLATSRSLRDGRFDADVFARIELPTWTCYALGGGRATKTAASQLAKPAQVWAANSFPGWMNAGGNGVLMRVAPHAFAAAARGVDISTMLLDVLRNGMCTHGHPRALVPACAHVMLLFESLQTGTLAPLQYLHEVLERLRRLPNDLAEDRDFGESFVPTWERDAKSSFQVAWVETIRECHDLVDEYRTQLARSDFRGAAEVGLEPRRYVDTLRRTGMLDKTRRGVGTGTFVAAYTLAASCTDPAVGLRLAANTFGSDTDTIATVAGAHIGTAHAFPQSFSVQDGDYIVKETLRLTGSSQSGHDLLPRYPDLLFWKPPKAQADFVGLVDGVPAIAGLAQGELVTRAVFDAKREFAWQWLRLEFGQHVVVKRRRELEELAPELRPRPRHERSQPSTGRMQPSIPASPEVDELRARLGRRQPNDAPRRVSREASAAESDVTIEQAILRAESAGLNPSIVGTLMLTLARQTSVEAAVAFAGQVALAARKTSGSIGRTPSRRNERHVVPGPQGGWMVNEPGTKKHSHHRTMGDAVEKARSILRSEGGGEVVIYDRGAHVLESLTITSDGDLREP